MITRSLDVVPVTRSASLDSLRQSWNRLAAGNPFQRWDWLEAWWRHMRSVPLMPGGPPPHTELYVLTVRTESGHVAGLAPWFRDIGRTGRTSIRFLGTGDACSEYLSVLCDEGLEPAVAEALADYLINTDRDAWDWIELDGVVAGDRAIAELASALSCRGAVVHTRAGANCWQIDLPQSWDAYLAVLSKSHRKQLRRSYSRFFEKGRVVWRMVRDADELEQGWQILTDLHTRRRTALGDSGLFACPAFAAFHREVVERFLAAGRLSLGWIELDGRPIAVDYSFAEAPTIYCYQSGMDPAALDVYPGQLSMIALIRASLERGYQRVDLLRGDEPYKAHWRAQCRPTYEWRFVSDKMQARLRHTLWLSRENIKRWVKRGVHGVNKERETHA